MSEEALQIAEKRREAIGKRGKERYTHLNRKFRRIARRDKKAFLSDQCKEKEENNRMGRLENSSRKLELPRQHFHAKKGTTNEINSMDLTEVQDIKKGWQQYTEELY